MKTRLLIFTFLLSLSMATSAWARLGETESAVIGRYGKPSVKMHRVWGDEERFSMNGFSIAVTFIKGVSVGEAFRTSGAAITDEQVSDLLSANSQGYSWEETPRNEIPKDIFHPVRQMWTRPNGSTAVLTDSSFEVKSIYLIFAQEDAAKQKPAAPSTQGF
jgi:hypothetical protein